MKASILIANYNNDKFIIECINSLINQTYKNIEIIFFDDKSTDASVEIVKKFKNVKLIINKEDKKSFGCYNQINSYKKALGESTGDIIFFLDSDDYFKTNKVEEVINEFKLDPNCKIIFDLPTFKFKRSEIIKKKNFFFYKTYWPFIPPQSCITISKKHAEQIIELIDFDIFPKIWMDFRVGIVSKYIFNQFKILKKSYTYYRQSDHSISSRYKFLSKNWWIRRMEAHDFIIYFFKKNNIKYKKNLDYNITKLINKIYEI